MKIAVTILLLGLAASSLIGTGDARGGADHKLLITRSVVEVLSAADTLSVLHDHFFKDLKKLLNSVGALLESIADEMNKTVEEVVDDMDLDNGLKECFLTGIKTGVWTDFITKHEDNPQTGLPVVMKAALKLAGKRVPDLNAKVGDELLKLAPRRVTTGHEDDDKTSRCVSSRL
ncbi:uncharacterized protein O3C94_003430 [Discoglossus pictus]